MRPSAVSAMKTSVSLSAGAPGPATRPVAGARAAGFVSARGRAPGVGWAPPAPRYTSGVFAKYVALVTSASEGAVTRADLARK